MNKKKCPVCGSVFNVIRDHYTNQGLKCKKGHEFTLCHACNELVNGLTIGKHCQRCGAIYELEKPVGPIPGMRFKNPFGELLQNSFHPRFRM